MIKLNIMETNMILSASGWRKVFAITNKEQDTTTEIGIENKVISIYAAYVFLEYVKQQTKKNNPVILCGTDSRPTGAEIADATIKTLVSNNINVKYIGITAAPEIMAYSKNFDGFIYISASHNPIGHNGIKFGLNTGGVLNGTENAKLVEKFNQLCEKDNAIEYALSIYESANSEAVKKIYDESTNEKQNALSSYKSFVKETISACNNQNQQEEIFSIIKNTIQQKQIGVVCDMNGSARSISIDKDFFAENCINFYAMNNTPGNIVHEIIPEAENLVHCASYMEKLQSENKSDAILGYMPDCDGDRGNIVYWDEKQKKSVILKAQEVFSLSVLAELSYSAWLNKDNKIFKPAVAVNCPTSMRIEEIAKVFNAQVFRAEVGEANVVNLAAKKRAEGYDVRIFGEGSNGGTITYPSAVRDPLNTIFAIIKLLSIKELFKMWCEKTNSTYIENYSLTDILNTLPKYTTTGVSENRAILHINTMDHSLLKSRFQKIFEQEYSEKLKTINEKYDITSYKVVLTNGTNEVTDETDFSKSQKGGLKIIFYSENNGAKIPEAFIWMRGSGTEPVFRIMCDVKGNRPEMEKEFLQWETEMLLKADSIL